MEDIWVVSAIWIGLALLNKTELGKIILAACFIPAPGSMLPIGKVVWGQAGVRLRFGG